MSIQSFSKLRQRAINLAIGLRIEPPYVVFLQEDATDIILPDRIHCLNIMKYSWQAKHWHKEMLN